MARGESSGGPALGTFRGDRGDAAQRGDTVVDSESSRFVVPADAGTHLDFRARGRSATGTFAFAGATVGSRRDCRR